MKLCRLIVLYFLSTSTLCATASALFWTFATTDVLDPGMGNFEVGTLFRPIINGPPTIPDAMFPTDIGFNMGFPKWGILKAEAGVDYYGGVRNPLFFNAKIGVEECKLFRNAPSLSFGILFVGTARETDFNVWNLMVGKTLPCKLGRAFLGGYFGNPSMGKDRGGIWGGTDTPFYKKKDCKGVDFYRWHILVDFATGDNIIGGAGVGIVYFYNPYISFMAGPTWFASNTIYGPWKIALYINVNFPVWRKK